MGLNAVHRNKHAIIRARHSVLTAVLLKFQVFLDVCCVNGLVPDVLNDHSASKTSATISPTTQCHILKDLNLHAVIHIHDTHMTEVAALSIYLFQLPTVPTPLAIKQKPKQGQWTLGQATFVL